MTCIYIRVILLRHNPTRIIVSYIMNNMCKLFMYIFV